MNAIVEKFKTPEGRHEVYETGRILVLKTRDKIVATWKSGRKGKAICVSGAIFLLWVGACVFGGNDDTKLSKGRFALRRGDLQTESKTDKLFYVKSGKDDGYAKVVPNLKKIPRWVHGGPLANCLNPHLDSELRDRNRAYLNDPDYTFGNWCIVDHVGDDYVIVRPSDPSWSGKFYGYIRTDDVYVERSNLRRGFYAFIGQKRVPLTNGSTMTMYAFQAVDPDVSQQVLDAVEYNINAEDAAKNENSRRDRARREHEKEIADAALFKTLENEMKQIQIPKIESQIHFPKDLKDSGIHCVLKNKGLIFVGCRGMTAEDLQQKIRNEDWDTIRSWAFCSDGNTPEEQAKSISDCYRMAERLVGFEEMARNDWHFNYEIYGVSSLDDKTGCEKKRLANADGYAWKVGLCEDIYIFNKGDSELLSLTADKKAFVDAFVKKHGK